MNFLDYMDLHLIINLSILVLLFGVFYYMLARRQQSITKMVIQSMKLQEQANHQLNLVVHELRRSNRLLSIMADVEEPEVSAQTMQGAHLSQAQANVHTLSTIEADPNSPFKVYVGNVDYAATAAELAGHFAHCGEVQFVNIPVNRYTGRARGFGFITFATQEGAEHAMHLNGSQFRGREIQVNFAKERDTVAS